MRRNIPVFYLLIFFWSFGIHSVIADEAPKHIKSKRIYQYKVNNGQVEAESRLLSETRYHKSGYIGEQIHYNRDGKEKTREENVYDENDRMIESRTSSATANIAKKVGYTYQEDLMVKAVSHNMASNISVIIENRYDEKGQLVESVVRSSDNRAYRRVISQYNDEGKIDKTEIYNIHGSKIGDESVIYTDAKGVTIKKRGAGQEIIRRIEKQLNDDGKIANQIEYDGQDRVIRKISNKYNHKGTLVEVVNEMPAANLKFRTTHTYNDNGDLFEINEFNKYDQLVKVVRMEYEYE